MGTTAGKIKSPKPSPEVRPKAFRDQYVLAEQIGTGSFANVHLGHNKKTKQRVAVKVTNHKGMSRDQQARLAMEVAVLKSLDHPHIIHLYGYYKQPDMCYMVMELCGGGELFDKICEKKRYNEKDARDLIRIVIDAVAYCHDRRVMHRDMKPENLLLADSDDMTSLKLADFGFAHKFEGMEEKVMGLLGTPSYVAPEILKNYPYGVAVDVWSVGVILYILLSGCTPFGGPSQMHLFKKIMQGEYYFDDRWKNVHEDAKDLIRGMLTVDPKKRLTARQALNHPWIQTPDHVLAERDLDSSLVNFRVFNARRKLKAGIDAVRLTTKLMRKHSSGSTETLSSIESVRSLSSDGPEAAAEEDNDESATCRVFFSEDEVIECFYRNYV